MTPLCGRARVIQHEAWPKKLYVPSGLFITRRVDRRRTTTTATAQRKSRLYWCEMYTTHPNKLGCERVSYQNQLVLPFLISFDWLLKIQSERENEAPDDRPPPLCGFSLSPQLVTRERERKRATPGHVALDISSLTLLQTHAAHFFKTLWPQEATLVSC